MVSAEDYQWSEHFIELNEIVFSFRRIRKACA